MRHVRSRSLPLCVLALGACLAGAAAPLRADEDARPAVIRGKLAKDDPRDAVRKESGHKVHEVKLEAGKCYRIDLSSTEFDPFLRLEDGQKRQLGFNDDIDAAAKLLDSRLCFAPLRTGTYRLIVTSYEAKQTGAYRLQVQALTPSGRPAVEQRRLDMDSRLANGRRFEVRPLTLAADTVQVVEAASKEFAPRLLLLDDNGKLVWDGVVEQGKDVARLAVAAGRAVRYRVFVTTAAEGERGTFAWRVTTYSVPASALAGKGKVDRAAVLRADAHAEGLKKQGRLAEAVAAHERVVQLARQALGPEHPDTARALNNLADCYRQQGQHGKAEPLFLRTLAIWESKLGKDHPDVALCLNNLGLLYQEQKEYGKAEPLYRRSLAIRESQLGKDHPDVAYSLNNLATLYHEQGRYGKAEALYRRTLAIWETQLGNHHPHVATTLNNLALLYREQGEDGKAEPLYRRSLAIWEKQRGKDHLLAATSLDNLATLYAAQKRWESANDLFDRARRSLRRHLARELAALPESEQLTWLRTRAEDGYHGALSLGWAQRDREAVRRASAAWLVNGQALAQEALSQQTLLQRDSAGQTWAPLAAELWEVRRQLAALAMRTPSAAALDTRRRLLDELGQREQDLAKRVVQLSGGSAGTSSWLELELLRQALPADGVLINLARFKVFDFQAGGKRPKWQAARYVAWLIDATDVRIVDLGAAANLDADVQAVRRELERAAATIHTEGEPDAEKHLRRALEALSQRVLHPLLPHVKDRPRWLIVPDGALWLVPWAALILPDGKYVVEKHTVSHLVSGRDLLPTESRVKPSAPVVLADPDFDRMPETEGAGRKTPANHEGGVALRRTVTLGAARFGRLPGTAAEAKLIAPKLAAYAGRPPRIHTGAEATEAAFKALKHPRVLVLCTHGFFLPDVERRDDDGVLRERPKRLVKPEENPLLRSGLALAGANARATAAERGVDDGILTALEILGTDLRGTELVVLSACETGLGEVRNGEGVAGLRQAFQLAGAQSVLATLWQIPDRQTAQLMGKFFDHLAAGRGRAEALRQAQLEVIRCRRQREGAAHPFFWAAFTLTGNWR